VSRWQNFSSCSQRVFHSFGPPDIRPFRGYQLDIHEGLTHRRLRGGVRVKTLTIKVMLFGRERECAVIESLLEGGRASRSGILILRGQPGVGKTALLEDAAASASDMQLLRGRGIESESELAFAALHQILRPVFSHVDALPTPQRSALRTAFAMEPGRGDDRFLISVSVLSLLAEAAERTPVVCLIDDAHWLDEASSIALAFVARRLEAEGVVLLFAAREGETRTFDAPGLPELYLQGLDREAGARLLREHAGVEIASDVAGRLVEETEGNPLALVELPSMLSSEQLSGQEPLPVPLPASEGIERAFLQRARKLPKETQTLLLLGAADDTGRWATVLEAAKLVGIDAGGLDAAEHAGLVEVRKEAFEFRHPLVRSAIYQGATTSERQVAHGTLAKALGSELDADRRAWHLAAATVEPSEAVVRELELAAERARNRSGFEAACAAMERAAQLTAEDEPRARRLTIAAENAWHAGQFRRAAGLLTGARSLAAEPLMRADIDRLRGLVEVGIGSTVTARQILVDAAREVAGTAPGRALEMLIAAANAAAWAADIQANVEIGRLATQLQTREPRERFLVSLLEANARFFEGDIAKAIWFLNNALRVAEEAAEPELIAEGAERVALFVGDDEAGYASRSRVVAEARAAGAVGNMIDSLFRLALVEIVTGRWTAASASSWEALRLAKETGQVELAALPLVCLTLLAALRGDEERLPALAREIGEIAAVHPMAYAEQAVDWAWGLFELGAGRPEVAVARLTKISHPGIRVISDFDCIEAAVFAKDEKTAGNWLQAQETFAEHSSESWARARVAHCRALRTHGEIADQGFIDALVHHERAHRPFERARTKLAYGAFLRRARRRTDARVQLRTALDIFEQLQAVPWAERARSELRASGESARRRDPSTITQLTPQEVQIARFVAQGFSNRDVAAKLFLSPRTIDFHLRNVFAKLGISRRTELTRLPLE
jgi:DNA-binding CsgD family transcriptional regulator